MFMSRPWRLDDRDVLFQFTGHKISMIATAVLVIHSGRM